MVVAAATWLERPAWTRRPATRASIAAIVIALGVFTPACSSEPAAPYGLGSIELPDGSEEIAAVLSEMPDSLEGYDANEVSTEQDDHMVGFSYGSKDQVAITVTDWGLGTGDFPPWTNEEMLPRFAESGEVAVAESVLTGSLLWLTGTNAGGTNGKITQRYWTMWFGAAASHWTFSILADSQQAGIAFVEAFVEAAS